MATQEQVNQFFATKPGKPHRVKVGGKFSFKSLPKDMQKKIKDKLAEKDDVMKKGLKGILPGIKINGKQVTKDNIHEFEKKQEKQKTKKVTKSTKKESTPKKITEKIKKIVKKEK